MRTTFSLRSCDAWRHRKAIELIIEAHTAGAGLVSTCSEVGISLRTLKRWRKAFLGDGGVHVPSFTDTPTRTKAVVTIKKMLASSGAGPDQSAAR